MRTNRKKVATQKVLEWENKHPIVMFIGGEIYYSFLLILGVGLCALVGGGLAWILM